MKIIAGAVLTVGVLAGSVSAIAQSHAAPPSPPRVPDSITNFLDITRGPPAPPERQFAPPPSSLAAPMARVPQVAPLSPRIGQ
jgi:hypothetical protein